MRRQNSGMTLLELIVASSLALLLLAILYQFSTTAYRVAHEEFERNAAESSILILSKQFMRDIETTTSAGVSLDPSGNIVAIHPVSLTDTGFLTYQNRFMAWHHDPQGRLVRMYEADAVAGVTFNGEAIRLTPAQMQSIPTSPDFREKRRYSKIKDFQLQNPTGVVAPHIGSPLKLIVSTELDRAETRKQLDFEWIIQLRTPAI